MQFKDLQVDGCYACWIPKELNTSHKRCNGENFNIWVWSRWDANSNEALASSVIGTGNERHFEFGFLLEEKLSMTASCICFAWVHQVRYMDVSFSEPFKLQFENSFTSY